MVMDELGFAFSNCFKRQFSTAMIVTVQAIGCDRVPSLRFGISEKSQLLFANCQLLGHADRLSNSSN